MNVFKKNKKGFTVVELVIVIAVIAILAAILIPTFNTLINKSRISQDKGSVTNMNKLLALEHLPGNKNVAFDDAKETLKEGGYPIPHSANSNDSIFYWLPTENRVVLYDKPSSKVVFPENFTDKQKESGWVDLSLGGSSGGGTQGGDSSETSSEETTPTEAAVLLSGSSFNSKIKQLCPSPTGIIFGKTSNYQDKTGGNSISVAQSGEVTAYLSGKTVYVLAPSGIKASSDCSSMFKNMSALTFINFYSFDTSSVTDMKSMFEGCTSLLSLDLSGFNTSGVTDMKRMFYNCSSVSNIYVTTSSSRWNINSVNSSASMFAYCTKLRDMTFWDSVLDFIGDFTGSAPDKSYANTTKDGLLTER